MNNNRLENEIATLWRCQGRFGLHAQPIIAQLREHEERRLPDVIPEKPEWQSFTWPTSGELDYQRDWREYDRGQPALGDYRTR